MKLLKEIEVDDGLIWVNIKMNLKSLEPLLIIEQRCMKCQGYGCRSDESNNGQVVEKFDIKTINRLGSSLSSKKKKKVRTSIKEFVDLFGNDQ